MSRHKQVLLVLIFLSLLRPVYAASDLLSSLFNGFLGQTTISFIVVWVLFSAIIYLLLIVLHPAGKLSGESEDIFGGNEASDEMTNKIYATISGVLGFTFGYVFWKSGFLENFLALIVLGGAIALAVFFMKHHSADPDKKITGVQIGLALVVIGYMAVWMLGSGALSGLASLAAWVGLFILAWVGYKKLKARAGSGTGGGGFFSRFLHGEIKLDEGDEKDAQDMEKAVKESFGIDTNIIQTAKVLKEQLAKVMPFVESAESGRKAIITRLKPMFATIKKELGRLIKLSKEGASLENYILSDNEKDIRKVRLEMIKANEAEKEIAQIWSADKNAERLVGNDGKLVIQEEYSIPSDSSSKFNAWNTIAGRLKNLPNLSKKLGDQDKYIKRLKEWLKKKYQMEEYIEKYTREMAVIRRKISGNIRLLPKFIKINDMSLREAEAILDKIIKQEEEIKKFEAGYNDEIEKLGKFEFGILDDLRKAGVFAKRPGDLPSAA